MFLGSFHELRPDALVIQTSPIDGAPDRVALEPLVLESPGPSATQLVIPSLYETFEDGNAVVASVLAWDPRQSDERLDALLRERHEVFSTTRTT